MTLEEFLKKTFEVNFGSIVRPNIVCNDEFTVSVQASAFHYCAPKDNCDKYTHVELGCPSKSDKLISEYARNKSRPRQTTYALVPVEVVQQLIDKHKGMNVEKTFG